MAERSVIDVSPKGCVDYANRLIELCKLPFQRISSIQNINSKFLISLFECISGLVIPDLLLSNDSSTEVHNIQAVIDTLSLDLLNMSLSHITGEDIVNGDICSILNLLEVLEALFLHIKSQNEKKLEGTFSEEKSSAVPSSDENIPPTRILKRKTCRKTLHKSHPRSHIPKTKMPVTSQVDSTEPSCSKRQSEDADGVRSPLKRKILKPSHQTANHVHAESIEGWHNLNFEKKVRTLLHCDLSPIPHALKMKKNYIQSLKAPLKKKPISPCNKSFLLPYNLRPKTKSSIPQARAKKKSSQRKMKMKCSVPMNAAKCEKASDLPSIFHSVLEEFPGFKFPKNTMDLLTKHYYQHVGQMHKQLKETLLKKPTKLIQAEKAMKDQDKLSKILSKDLKEKNYLKELNEHKMVENVIKSGFRDARLQSAKTRQYFDEFHKSMRKKMQKRNFSEEVLIEKTFKEILSIQKEKVRWLCQKVKETDEQDAKQHRQYLDALQNLYEQQLELLAESIDAEQKDSLERRKEKKLAVDKMNQEFRKKLLTEVRCLQKDVLEFIKDIHFRELDAQNFIERFRQEDS